MAWDSTLQKRTHIPPVRMETGTVTAAGVSGQTFTVDSKLSRVWMGIGIMQTDGLVAFATIDTVSGGTVTFTRYGPIVTSADTIQYVLIGR
jgi:hypothetical protein